jgi:hypothetical protein
MGHHRRVGDVLRTLDPVRAFGPAGHGDGRDRGDRMVDRSAGIGCARPRLGGVGRAPRRPAHRGGARVPAVGRRLGRHHRPGATPGHPPSRAEGRRSRAGRRAVRPGRGGAPAGGERGRPSGGDHPRQPAGRAGGCTDHGLGHDGRSRGRGARSPRLVDPAPTHERAVVVGAMGGRLGFGPAARRGRRRPPRRGNRGRGSGRRRDATSAHGSGRCRLGADDRGPPPSRHGDGSPAGARRVGRVGHVVAHPSRRARGRRGRAGWWGPASGSAGGAAAGRCRPGRPSGVAVERPIRRRPPCAPAPADDRGCGVGTGSAAGPIRAARPPAARIGAARARSPPRRRCPADRGRGRRSASRCPDRGRVRRRARYRLAGGRSARCRFGPCTSRSVPTASTSRIARW